MLVRETVRDAILGVACIALMAATMPSGAAAFTKSQCTGCGCKYTIDCESGPQGAWCMKTCLCPAGTPDGCMGNRLSGVSGLRISKSASQTMYKLKVAPEKK